MWFLSVAEGPQDLENPTFLLVCAREIFRGFSVKGGLSHMTMWMKNTFEYGIKVKFSLGKIINLLKK